MKTLEQELHNMRKELLSELKFVVDNLEVGQKYDLIPMDTEQLLFDLEILVKQARIQYYRLIDTYNKQKYLERSKLNIRG